jgi:uncharacterized DUF497 family protein
MAFQRLQRCQGFEWDKGNAERNWEKHKGTPGECEQVFFDRPLVVGEDVADSRTEPRYYALGTTDAGKPLFIVFRIRGDLIRVISARRMNRRERRIFDNASKEEKEDPQV